MDVQLLAFGRTAGMFSAFIAATPTYHSGFKDAMDFALSDAAIISLLAGGTNIQTIINSVFSTTIIFTALKNNSLSTLWANIMDEVSPDSDILDYYEANYTEAFVHQCIIVLPSFIDSYITQGVSSYLQLVKAFYSNKQYKALMAALTELYFTPTQTLELAEWHIYGSSRLGIYKADKGLALVEDETITEIEYQTHVKIRYNGKKQYELSNHLGNVLVTISDRRTAICNDSNETEGYESVVVTATDYYAFGSPLIGRSWKADSVGGYRFGYNGKENDNEVKSDGNSQDYGMRIYDGRLGRWLRVDPLQQKYPSLSPFNFCNNSPVIFQDVDGKDFEMKIYMEDGKRKISIKADIYAISKRAAKEASSGAKDWNALSGSIVTIDGVEFEVEVSVNVINARSHSKAERKAHNVKFANGYFSDRKIDSDEKNTITSKFDARKDETLDLTLGKTIDDKYITIPENIIKYTDEVGSTTERVLEPLKNGHNIGHEIGHLLGLDDLGGEYYNAGGVTDYSVEAAPSSKDLKTIIKYGINNSSSGSGNANVKLDIKTNAAAKDNGDNIDFDK